MAQYGGDGIAHGLKGSANLCRPERNKARRSESRRITRWAFATASYTSKTSASKATDQQQPTQFAAAREYLVRSHEYSNFSWVGYLSTQRRLKVNRFRANGELGYYGCMTGFGLGRASLSTLRGLCLGRSGDGPPGKLNGIDKDKKRHGWNSGHWSMRIQCISSLR